MTRIASVIVDHDGIDPDSTLNMTISNSWIDVGDDAICPKARTGCKAGVQGSCYKHGLSNLLVVNNVARSRSSAFKIGSTTQLDIEDILVVNLTVRDSNRGLGIQHRDNGTVRNIEMRNVHIESTSRQPITWWGAGEPIWITSTRRRVDGEVGLTSTFALST